MKKQIELAKKGYMVTKCGLVTNPTGYTLKTNIGTTGYEKISIPAAIGGKMHKVVHRVVAQAYLPNPKNKPLVNHKDGNKLNNHVDNLEWVTCSENMLHSARVLKKGLSDANGNVVINRRIAKHICDLLSKGHRQSDIGVVLGVSKPIISAIYRRKCWNHISTSYIFPAKARVISDSTVKWICLMLEEGKTNREILNMSNSNVVTSDAIKDIKRRRCYKDISINYEF